LTKLETVKRRGKLSWVQWWYEWTVQWGLW